jgi:hypothetical protein
MRRGNNGLGFTGEIDSGVLFSRNVCTIVHLDPTFRIAWCRFGLEPTQVATAIAGPGLDRFKYRAKPGDRAILNLWASCFSFRAAMIEVLGQASFQHFGPLC